MATLLIQIYTCPVLKENVSMMLDSKGLQIHNSLPVISVN